MKMTKLKQLQKEYDERQIRMIFENIVIGGAMIVLIMIFWEYLFVLFLVIFAVIGILIIAFIIGLLVRDFVNKIIEYLRWRSKKHDVKRKNR